MKELYFPTTTLNFNNILSSESLSPRAFYDERGYGYRSWNALSAQELANGFVLYEEPFCFNRPDSGQEDHPLLISLQVDESRLIPLGEGKWLCDHTLYLSPWRTRFILFSEQDKLTMLVMSESSLETKMTGLYHKRIEVQQYTQSYSPETTEVSDVALNAEALAQDIQINKLKGLLYGYYIGAMLSMPSEWVSKHNQLQEIGNIFAAIASTPDRRPMPIQDERLSALIDKMNAGCPALADFQQRVSPNVQEFLDWTQAWRLSIPGLVSKSDLLYSLASQTPYASEWLSQQQSALETERVKGMRLLLPEAEEIVLCGGKISTLTAAGSHEPLVKRWIDEVLCDKSYNSKVGQYKDDLATALTLKARDFFGESWEGCPEREQLNSMRRFVAGQEPMQAWDNGFISSIAAVLSKGEDWDKLLAFMQSKGMNDYRLAFAFYGVLHGFADLTRDFTDQLLDYPDRHYVADVVKEFNGQLLGDDLAGSSVPEGEEEEESSIGKQVESQIPALSLDPHTQAALTDIVAQVGKLEMDVQNFTALLYIADNVLCKKGKKQPKTYQLLKEYIETHQNDHVRYTPEEFRSKVHEICAPGLPTSKDKKSEMLERINRCIELEAKRDDPQAFLFILDNFLDPKSQEYKNIARLVQGEEPIKPKPIAIQRELPFDNHVPIVKGEEILTDRSWIEETARFIEGARNQKQYREDADWFVKNYDPSYRDKKGGVGIYASKDKSNERVVERFRRYLNNKLGNNKLQMQWLREIYQDIPIDEIIRYIKEKYGC